MKALMVAIQPKPLKMILDGISKFVFPNWKVPVGTVIYFYCTKAKPHLWYEHLYCDTPVMLYDSMKSLNDIGITQDDLLNGKVVAKAVVKQVSGWEKENAFRVITDKGYPVRFRIDDWTWIGFDEKNPSEYALELSQVEEIEPKDVTEFVSWSKSDLVGADIYVTHPPQSRTWIYVKESEDDE